MIEWLTGRGMLGVAWTTANQEWLTSDHLRSWSHEFHRAYSNVRRRPSWANNNTVFSWARSLGVRQRDVEGGQATCRAVVVMSVEVAADRKSKAVDRIIGFRR